MSFEAAATTARGEPTHTVVSLGWVVMIIARRILTVDWIDVLPLHGAPVVIETSYTPESATTQFGITRQLVPADGFNPELIFNPFFIH